MDCSINVFGTGELAREEDLEGAIYAQCTACSSIYAEYLSWANNRSLMKMLPKLSPVTWIAEAHHVVVLSCQVTDLAILNDLMTLDKLTKQYPNKKFWIGGCLARRFDIPLPEGVGRLDALRHDRQFIWRTDYVGWNPPFWVQDFSEHSSGEGHLFRSNYPLRIGVGCSKACTYCTIRTTRGAAYQLHAGDLEREFLAFEDVVLIADSPSEQQVIDWCEMALRHEKPISLRNVEPAVAMNADVFEMLSKAASDMVLDVLHSPIQSNIPETLKDMGRPVIATMDYIAGLVSLLQSKGTKVATNIIIDYKDFPNPKVDHLFDSVVWNPYWDGVWDRAKAVQRWNHYFPWNRIEE